MKHRYFILYKPYGVICQFSPEGDHTTLKDITDLPEDVYPVGRLDTDSEGLLILTNDKTVNGRLLNPKNRHFRSYLVQVDGDITEDALQELASGVEINLKGKKHNTLPAIAEKIPAPNLPERNPAIRVRKNIPTSWIRLTLTEGKNRQVRRMTAKVGFPTLRLVRERIEGVLLGTLQPGEIKELQEKIILQKLKLK